MKKIGNGLRPLNQIQDEIERLNSSQDSYVEPQIYDLGMKIRKKLSSTTNKRRGSLNSSESPSKRKSMNSIEIKSPPRK